MSCYKLLLIALFFATYIWSYIIYELLLQSTYGRHPCGIWDLDLLLLSLAASTISAHRLCLVDIYAGPSSSNTFLYLQSAFRIKAKEFHPDQNQDNKGCELIADSIQTFSLSCDWLIDHTSLLTHVFSSEYAEARFKEVMVSYEAIKSERKNNGCSMRPWEWFSVFLCRVLRGSAYLGSHNHEFSWYFSFWVANVVIGQTWQAFIIFKKEIRYTVGRWMVMVNLRWQIDAWYFCQYRFKCRERIRDYYTVVIELAYCLMLYDNSKSCWSCVDVYIVS